MLHEGGEISPKNQWYITDISPIYHRYITDFLPPEEIFWKNLRYISPNRYIGDISPIFWRYLRKYLLFDFSPWNIVSTPPDTRYIGDISPIYPDIFLHGYRHRSKFRKKWMKFRQNFLWKFGDLWAILLLLFFFLWKRRSIPTSLVRWSDGFELPCVDLKILLGLPGQNSNEENSNFELQLPKQAFRDPHSPLGYVIHNMMCTRINIYQHW